MITFIKSLFDRPKTYRATPALELAEHVAMVLIRNGLSPHRSAVSDILPKVSPTIRDWMQSHGIPPDIESKLGAQPLSDLLAFEVTSALAQSTAAATWWNDPAHAKRIMESTINEVLASEEVITASDSHSNAPTPH